MSEWEKYLSLPKVKRIEVLSLHGFNVPLYKAVKSIQDLKDFIKEHELQRVSIRTYAANEQSGFKCPHLPNRPSAEAIEEVKKLLDYSNKYQIMVSEGIDPACALFRGNAVFSQFPPTYSNEFIIEYLEGPGTVRDLESNPAVKHIQGKLYQIPHPEVREVAQALYASGVKDVLFEWSVYNYPLGVLRRPLIFWEFRRF